MFFNVSFHSLSLKLVKENSPLITSCNYLSLKNSYFSNSFSNFIRIKSESSKFSLSQSSFKNYLAAVIDTDSYNPFPYKNTKYTKTQTFSDAEITNCQFINCNERAMRLFDFTGNITIIKCTFTNCFHNNKRMNGGAIEFIGDHFCISNSKFESCKCGAIGSAIYVNAHQRCKIVYTDFNKCSDEIRNLNSTVFMNCTGGNGRSVNNSHSMSFGNAGFFIHIVKKANFRFYNAYNVSGTCALASSVNFPLQYGNIIYCRATSGLVEAQDRDAFITNYYFANNNGFLVSIMPNLIVIFTDCIFKDHDQRPKAGNLALRGKYLLNNCSRTPFIDYGKKHMLSPKEFPKTRIYGLVFLFASCGFLILLWFVLQPVTFDDESKEEQNLPLEKNPSKDSPNSSKEYFSSKEDLLANNSILTKNDTQIKKPIPKNIGVYKRTDAQIKKTNK